MTRISALVKRHRLTTFFILAYALSWWAWIPYALGVFPNPVASFGPFLLRSSCWRSPRARLVCWACFAGWFAGALRPDGTRWRCYYQRCLPLSQQCSTSCWVLKLRLQPNSAPGLASFPFCNRPSHSRSRRRMGGARLEGYAVPRLQYGRSALVASLILGVLIAGWHLPLIVVEVHYPDFVLIIAAVIVFNWVFNNANGSVLIVMLMHAANNAVSGSFFSPMFSGADSARQSWLLALVWAVVAVLVIAISGSDQPPPVSTKGSRNHARLLDLEPGGCWKPPSRSARSDHVFEDQMGRNSGLGRPPCSSIMSAILNQMSPASADGNHQRQFPSASSRCLHRSDRCRARHPRTAQRNASVRPIGVTGTVLTIAGYAIIAVMTVISMVQGHPSLLTVRLAGAGLVLVGSALLGVIIMRARLLPWWCGVLLIVTFPLGHFANAIFSSAENLLLALLWGSVGVALLSRRQRSR